MNNAHDTYRDLMVDVLFGEAAPDERRRLRDHLDACEACAAEFESLQATLQATAERERPEPPPSFWSGYRERLHERMQREGVAEQHPARTDRSSRPAGTAAPSLPARLRRWWAGLPELLPQSAPQWALQGAMALVLLGAGVWLGGLERSASPDGPVPSSADGDVSSLVYATNPVHVGAATARPSILGIDDIAYDATENTVSIRYATATRITVTGTPDDPSIQRLLRAALLDGENPSSRLHAVKALERTPSAPDPAVVEALTVLASRDENDALRLRAVRALRSMHADRRLPGETREVLIGVLLDDDNEALRVEVLQALTAGPAGGEAPSYLRAVREDSNAYLRYRARELLQPADRRMQAGL